MKRCFKCGIVKSLDEFYRFATRANRLSGKCKECTKADAKEYERNNPDKVRAWKRERARRPASVEKRRQWIAKNPEKRQNVRSSWVWRNQDKVKAEAALNHAIRDGKIKRGSMCQRCASTKHIEAHHHDYSKPLDVEWLCTKCHGETRRK